VTAFPSNGKQQKVTKSYQFVSASSHRLPAKTCSLKTLCNHGKPDGTRYAQATTTPTELHVLGKSYRADKH
jgi:hypothetical protein